MHFIIKYNRKEGKVVDVKEYVDKDWDKAFKDHMDDISNEPNPDVAISLVDAPNRSSLNKLFGAFFH